MKRILLLLVLLAATLPAYAQNQCVCPGGTCRFASDPFPLTGTPTPPQPTGCKLFRGGTQVASAGVVQASTLAGQTGLCLPSQTPYPTAPAGAVACLVATPLSPGTYTMTMTAYNAAQESPVSASYVVEVVTSLAPPTPTNLRIVP